MGDVPVAPPPAAPPPPPAGRSRLMVTLATAGVVAIAAVGVAAVVKARGRHRSSGSAAVAAGPTSFLTNFQPLDLVDHTGQRFDLRALDGQVVLFNFIFTSCPNVCPVQTQALAEVQRKLPGRIRDRVHFVSVSIDPVHDTPAALRSFAQQFKVDFARWTFVTGGTGDIDRLADRLRLFAENKERRPENHGTTLWLMDAQGRLMQRYAGNPPEVPRLVNELDALVRLND